MASRMMMMKNCKASLQQLILRQPMNTLYATSQMSPSIRELLYEDRCKDDDRLLHSIWRPNPKSHAEHALFRDDDDALQLRIAPFADQALAGARGRPRVATSDDDEDDDYEDSDSEEANLTDLGEESGSDDDTEYDDDDDDEERE